MIRRRGHGPEGDASSSDDEEDAFSALSKKVHAKKKAKSAPLTCDATTKRNREEKIRESNVTAAESSVVESKSGVREFSSCDRPQMTVTSSIKRHHKPNDTRKAKMDALLQELEAKKNELPKTTKRFVPEKKGSFVVPGEEHLTSNLFVGNLAPSIAEEDLSNLFSQFGELYSVKIMWPRTLEEKNRRRNTGFVCFMNRDDAEEAMEACDETDPFNNGRLLTLRWGKNVKKKRLEESITTTVQKTKDSIRNSENSIGPITSSDEVADGSTSGNFPQALKNPDSGMSTMPKMEQYDPKVHASKAIRVEIPTDRSRFHFISITASYIAKDPELEQRLRDEEVGNSLFNFLSRMNNDDKDQKEKIFFRWRVYSFCQGDTYSIWRTKPFLMFSNGRYWIPPPLDVDAANKEKADLAEKERRHRQQKEDRVNRELMTGRQFERRKRRGEFGTNNSKLNPEQLFLFDQLVRQKLSLSRKTICQAMSFCFDNCVAAQEVCALLKEALLDESDSVTNDMRIARLYLLSDILFNSQQPGVKNAFMYRSTIESMAGSFFREFGNLVRRKEQRSGRITVNRLRKAVSAVLGAWTEWGVYNATFVDELEAHFEGRELKNEANDCSDHLEANCQKTAATESPEEVDDVVIHGQRGDWKEVSDEVNERKNKEIKASKKPMINQLAMIHKSVKDETHQEDGNDNPSDVDGEELYGEDLENEDIDGEDLDGEDLQDEDFDGAELSGEGSDRDSLSNMG